MPSLSSSSLFPVLSLIHHLQPHKGTQQANTNAQFPSRNPPKVVSLVPPSTTETQPLCDSDSHHVLPNEALETADAFTANMAAFGSFAANVTAPDRSPQKEELPLSENRDFAASGKVMMLVLVLLFASLFIFLVVLLCTKHRRIHSHARGLRSHNRPAGQPGLHPSTQFPTANQVKGRCAGSGENLDTMNAHQSV